jgi:hypothetical protein
MDYMVRTYGVDTKLDNRTREEMLEMFGVLLKHKAAPLGNLLTQIREGGSRVFGADSPSSFSVVVFICFR